jgi:hypothetical protein
LNRVRGPLAVGAGAAGLALALVFLVGFADGPVILVVGGLAIAMLAAAAIGGPGERLFTACGVAVVAGALLFPALRWQTLDLAGLRGIQAVLGPTLLVGPAPIAVSAGVAAGGGLVALGLATGPATEDGWGSRAWAGGGAAVASFAGVTVFYGPAIPGWGAESGPGVAGDVVSWALAVVAATGATLAIAVTSRRLPSIFRWIVMGISAAAVIAGAGVMAAALNR